MILARMIDSDEDALYCDMAQYYHIYDLQALPLPAIARLAAGLPYDSRSYRKIVGVGLFSEETMLLARLYDELQIFMRLFVEAHSGKRSGKYESLWEMYKDSIKVKEKKNDTKAFSSIEEFERARIAAFANAIDQIPSGGDSDGE